MRHFYVFFYKLPNLLKATNYRPHILEKSDHFDFFPLNTFILFGDIECKNNKIMASKKVPLFGISFSFMLDQNSNHINRQKATNALKDLERQPFFKSAILCNQHDINKNWIYTTIKGEKKIKKAQYFANISSMVKYCCENKLVDLRKMSLEDKKLIDIELMLEGKY